MTAIKQVAVTSTAHAGNLGRYLNDERALARDSQHLVDEGNWEAEMAKTREAYGHDKPSRAGSKNTVMYHQVLAFNPDECSMNGGKVTPEFAMKYAQDYVSTRYPSHEAVWVLHEERCKADATLRYAVHIGINRTNLETGRRLTEGRGDSAKVARANAVRVMDAKHGLRQLVEGQRNSRVHARQPTRQERAMAARGVRSDKQYLREAIKASVKEVGGGGEGNKMRALAASLDRKGVSMTMSPSGKNLEFERRSTGLKVRDYKLGRGFSAEGIAKGLGIEGAKLMARSMDEGMESR